MAAWRWSRAAPSGRARKCAGCCRHLPPLTLSWSGTGELKTLHKAEWRGGLPLPGGSALLCGFYLNELLLKLLPREDPHPALFDEYAAALRALAGRPAAGGSGGRPARASKCGCSRNWAMRCR